MNANTINLIKNKLLDYTCKCFSYQLLQSNYFIYNIDYINIMKRTFQPNKKKRAKVSGFRKRNSTTKGRKVLKARRMKGRAKLSSSDEK